MAAQTPVQSVDLSSVDGFASAVEQIRASPQNKELQNSPYVQLNVKLPSDQNKNEQSITLFIATENQYIVGMVGGDGTPYYFRDQEGSGTSTSTPPPPEGFSAFLKKAGLLKDNEEPSDSSLGMSHQALGTFRRGNKAGHTFRMDDLMHAGKISSYGKHDKMRTPEDLQKPVSLLVCMLAESARFNHMETEFRKIYSPGTVNIASGGGVNVPTTASADEAVQQFDKSIRVAKWADTWVNELRPFERVEVLGKRAAVINNVLDKLVAIDGIGRDATSLNNILSGKYEGKGKADAQDILRYTRDLKHSSTGQPIDGENLSQILTMHRTSPVAFRAALTGVCTALAPRPKKR